MRKKIKAPVTPSLVTPPPHPEGAHAHTHIASRLSVPRCGRAQGTSPTAGIIVCQRPLQQQRRSGRCEGAALYRLPVRTCRRPRDLVVSGDWNQTLLEQVVTICFSPISVLYSPFLCFSLSLSPLLAFYHIFLPILLFLPSLLHSLFFLSFLPFTVQDLSLLPASTQSQAHDECLESEDEYCQQTTKTQEFIHLPSQASVCVTSVDDNIKRHILAWG